MLNNEPKNRMICLIDYAIRNSRKADWRGADMARIRQEMAKREQRRLAAFVSCKGTVKK